MDSGARGLLLVKVFECVWGLSVQAPRAPDRVTSGLRGLLSSPEKPWPGQGDCARGLVGRAPSWPPKGCQHPGAQEALGPGGGPGRGCGRSRLRQDFRVGPALAGRLDGRWTKLPEVY